MQKCVASDHISNLYNTVQAYFCRSAGSLRRKPEEYATAEV